MLGQVGFFAFYVNGKTPVALDRYVSEVGRLMGVLESRLHACFYRAGDDY